MMPSVLNGTAGNADRVEQADPGRKLAILCLHGFRQNAKQFKGRLAGLQKRLADVATLKFIDAPYVLPLWYKQQAQQAQQQQQQQQRSSSCTVHSLSSDAASQQHLQQQLPHYQISENIIRPSEPPVALPNPKRAWLLSHELLAAQPQLQTLFAEDGAQIQHHHGPQHQQQQQQQDERAMPEGGPSSNLDGSPQCTRPTPNVERGVQQAQHAGNQHEKQLPLSVWQQAPEAVITADQHTTQCCGWQQSWQVIQAALRSEEQIDGILGFSQGAAVAAVVAALLQLQERVHSEGRQQAEHWQQTTNQTAQDLNTTSGVCRSCQSAPMEEQHKAGASTVKFVILASGFISPDTEHQELLNKQTPISLPSLHVYAAGEGSSDRQIQQQLSEELMQLFDPKTRQQLVHDAGHLLPCNRAFVDTLKSFLQEFM